MLVLPLNQYGATQLTGSSPKESPSLGMNAMSHPRLQNHMQDRRVISQGRWDARKRKGDKILSNHSTLLREDPPYSRRELTPRPTLGQCAKTSGYPQSWVGCLHQTPSLKARGAMWRADRRLKDCQSQRWWMTPRKQCLTDSSTLRIDSHVNSWRLYQDTPPQVQARQGPGTETWGPPSHQHWYLLSKGKAASSNGIALSLSTTLQPYNQSRSPVQD